MVPKAPARIPLLLCGIGIILLTLACSSSDSPQSSVCATGGEPAQGNLLQNPGFEEGSEPWLATTTSVNADPRVHFSRTEAIAHSGTASAHLQMGDPAEASGAKVYYLVQEITPSEFPDKVKGFYRVENWH